MGQQETVPKFRHIDLEMSTERYLSALKTIRVRANEHADFYDLPDRDVDTEIKEYLCRVLENGNKIRLFVLDYILSALVDAEFRHGTDAAWIALRASVDNGGLPQSRWHRDGLYFKSEKPLYKLLLPLKGPATRLARVTNLERFRKLEHEIALTTDELLESELQRQVDECIEEVFVDEETQTIEILAGDEGMVHSEPIFDTTSCRLFVSIVVGTSKQISMLAHSRG